MIREERQDAPAHNESCRYSVAAGPEDAHRTGSLPGCGTRRAVPVRRARSRGCPDLQLRPRSGSAEQQRPPAPKPPTSASRPRPRSSSCSRGASPGGSSGATVEKAFFLSFSLTPWKNCGLIVFLGHRVAVALRASAPLSCMEKADLPPPRGPVGPLVLAEPWSEGFDALLLANVTQSYEDA